MAKVYLHGLGCDKNTVDGEYVLGDFVSAGCSVTDDPADADIIVINTCCFIESAKTESIEAIFSLLEYDATIVVTGCMAERYGDELRAEIPEIDYIIGLDDQKRIAEIVTSIPGKETRLTSERSSAYLKIADGCDRACTYCIIPKIKGAYRSTPLEELVREAAELKSEGVEELILVAQDTSCYGKDSGSSLIELLEELVKLDFKWIRLLYLYPEGVDDELVTFISENESILPYFDLPIQHTSDRILKKMGRRISRAEIFDKIDMIRENLPDAVIRSTVIVGFPGESETDFTTLLEDLEALRFDRLGAFAYSREEGTPAYSMEQLDRELITDRLSRLENTQNRIMREQNTRFRGQTYPVLIEERIDDQTYSGRIYADAPEIDCVVYVSSDEDLTIGSFYETKIVDTLDYELLGDLDESSQ